jgi:hypothetical protein
VWCQCQWKEKSDEEAKKKQIEEMNESDYFVARSGV